MLKGDLVDVTFVIALEYNILKILKEENGIGRGVFFLKKKDYKYLALKLFNKLKIKIIYIIVIYN